MLGWRAANVEHLTGLKREFPQRIFRRTALRARIVLMKVLERLPESRDKLSMLPQGRVGLKERRQAGPIMSLRSDERNKAPHVRYQFMESCRGENVSGSQC